MADTTSSTNMSLPVPVVGVDPGPQWATDINTCLSIIDVHDHSAGNGVQITPAGINITADLPFLNNNAISLRTARFTSQSAVLAAPTDLGCLYEVLNDLYFNDGLGNQVRITQSGGVAGSPGSIANLTSPASASYVSASQTFVWQSAANTPANNDGASLILRNLTASSKGLTLSPPNAMGADYSIILPSLPGSTKFVSLDASGNMGAAWAVDNSTIEVSTNSVQVKDHGITQVKLGNANYTLSSSCGSFSTIATSFTNVTNLSCSITTTGRPVLITLQSDAGASSIGASGTTGGVGEAIFRFVRDVTEVSRYTLETIATPSSGTITPSIFVPSSSLSHTDFPSAGTYVYKVQCLALASGMTASVTNAKLLVREV